MDWKKPVKYLLLISLFQCIGFEASAQYENVWMFGKGAGLDFNSGGPVFVESKIDGFGEACASVCDENGRLLFYTEGSYVWNKNGDTMPNGKELLPLRSTTNFSVSSSTTQGTIIIPVPKSSHRYYVFSLTSIEQNVHKGKLYYSVVDMSLNNGLGDVVAAQKGILLATGLTEKMTAVAGNRCNIWLLVTTKSELKAYEVNEQGVSNSPVVSLSGTTIFPSGCLVASPDSKKLVFANFGTSSVLCDFDAATGRAANPLQLSANFSYGACFSPDNSMLYLYDQGGGGGNQVCQYDLTLGSDALINASRTQLGPASFTHLKTAPNGKIYFNSSERNAIGCIDFPDKPGVACGFRSVAIQLPGQNKTSSGLPHIVPLIHYDSAHSWELFEGECFSNVRMPQITARDTTGWDYTWSNGAAATSTRVSAPGIYRVRYYTSPCMAHTDTFEVRFPYGVLPDIQMQPACRDMQNGKAWLSVYPGDTVTYKYVWQDSTGKTLSQTDTLHDAGSGYYTLRVTTAQCDTLVSLFLREESFPVSFISDSFVCERNDMMFTNTSDAHYTAFSWDFGDGTGSSSPNPKHPYAHAGNYTIRLTGSGALCRDTAYGLVTVDSLLSPGFTVIPDSVCAGTSVTILSENNSATINSVRWDFGDGNTRHDVLREIHHAYDGSGIMPLTLTTRYRVCPEAKFTRGIFVQPLPQVYLGPDTSLCLNGNPVVLQNKSSRNSISHSHMWSTGDTTEALRVTHPGRYSLTVTGGLLGCSNSESVVVTKDCAIDIPNIFTPNGDGLNDYFFPRQLLSSRISSFNMQVFDRWGRIVFETDNSLGKGWDGKYNNADQPEGAYLYIIDARFDGRTERYSGNVTLLR